MRYIYAYDLIKKLMKKGYSKKEIVLSFYILFENKEINEYEFNEIIRIMG